MTFSCIDHGLDSKGHAFGKNLPQAWRAIVEDLGLFVKNLPNAMAAILSNDGIIIFFRVTLNHVTDVSQGRSGSNNLKCLVKSFLRDTHQSLCMGCHIAHADHNAGVTMPAVLDHSNVDVDDVTIAELFVV